MRTVRTLITNCTDVQTCISSCWASHLESFAAVPGSFSYCKKHETSLVEMRVEFHFSSNTVCIIMLFYSTL